MLVAAFVVGAYLCLSLEAVVNAGFCWTAEVISMAWGWQQSWLSSASRQLPMWQGCISWPCLSAGKETMDVLSHSLPCFVFPVARHYYREWFTKRHQPGCGFCISFCGSHQPLPGGQIPNKRNQLTEDLFGCLCIERLWEVVVQISVTVNALVVFLLPL